MIEKYCRCPGCGECDAARHVEELVTFVRWCAKAPEEGLSPPAIVHVKRRAADLLKEVSEK